jgi:hypothetical protein
MMMHHGQRKQVAHLSLADIMLALERYTLAECPEFFELNGVTERDGKWEIDINLGLTGYGSLHAQVWFRKSKEEPALSALQAGSQP